ncbi:NAD-dependent epimerase/dehydratase family protein [Dactylosporangium sp. CA-052675]|uniref:NAD-dependent epimerase/dehydratase family protein n=1 Tax=Dactylosporangium sp. CA-052675 TaxID=3239927 RepID=UPI003D8D066E
MILVTGGLGFIGSHTTRALYDLGVPVLPASRHPRSSGILPSAMEAATVDCTDPESLFALGRRHRITGIVHLAAAPLGEGTALDDLEQNTASAFAILRAAAAWGVDRVVLASTIGIYAGVDETPWREDAPLPLASPHPIPASKKIAEIVALASGLDVVVARIGGIWGPQGRPSSPFIAAPALIHDAAAQIRSGETEPTPIHDTATQSQPGATNPAHVQAAATEQASVHEAAPQAHTVANKTADEPTGGVHGAVSGGSATRRGGDAGGSGGSAVRDGGRMGGSSRRGGSARRSGGSAGGSGGSGGAVYGGDGADILYARDCGAALALLATAPGLRHRLYNVGSGRVTTNAEVVAAITAVHPEVVLPLADGVSGPGPIPCLDTARLAAEGWVPSWPLDRAVPDYLDWLAAGRAR